MPLGVGKVRPPDSPSTTDWIARWLTALGFIAADAAVWARAGVVTALVIAAVGGIAAVVLTK